MSGNNGNGKKSLFEVHINPPFRLQSPFVGVEKPVDPAPSVHTEPETEAEHRSKFTDAMLEAIHVSLRNTTATYQAWPIFRTSGGVVYGDVCQTKTSNLSIILANAARYVIGQQWLVDIYVQTSTQDSVYAMSAMVEESDENGVLVARRVISVTSPIFEPYRLALERACVHAIANNLSGFRIPQSMRRVKAAPEPTGWGPDRKSVV
jgi:hypothetical protein